MNATPPPLPRRVNRTPLLFSALVYPGSGQFMTGRKIAGLAYAACFTLAAGIFLLFVSRYFHDILAFFRAWWSGGWMPDEKTPSPRRMLMPFLYMAIVYLANLYDIAWHLYRPLPRETTK